MRSGGWTVWLGFLLCAGCEATHGQPMGPRTLPELEQRLGRVEAALEIKNRQVDGLTVRLAAAEAELLAMRPPSEPELEALARGIRAEPQDPAWSASAESALRGALSSGAWPPGTNLSFVHCAAQRCVAELEHASMAALALFERANLAAARLEGAAPPTTRRRVDREHVRTYYFWDRLGRPGRQTGSEALDPWR